MGTGVVLTHSYAAEGAKVPTGETKFQFQAGTLNVHSESYDWLVGGVSPSY